MQKMVNTCVFVTRECQVQVELYHTMEYINKGVLVHLISIDNNLNSFFITVLLVTYARILISMPTLK